MGLPSIVLDIEADDNGSQLEASSVVLTPCGILPLGVTPEGYSGLAEDVTRVAQQAKFPLSTQD